MLAHFKWNGLWHLLELFLVNLAGKFCMQIMQISTSAYDDDCDFFFKAVTRLGCVRFVAGSFCGDCCRFFTLFSFLFCTSSRFCCFALRWAMFSDVSTAIFTGLRPRLFFFFCDIAARKGPIFNKTEAILNERDIVCGVVVDTYGSGDGTFSFETIPSWLVRTQVRHGSSSFVERCNEVAIWRWSLWSDWTRECILIDWENACSNIAGFYVIGC